MKNIINSEKVNIEIQRIRDIDSFLEGNENE